MKNLVPRFPMSATTRAWLLLCALSDLSVVLAAQSHAGATRMGLTLLVAALAWAKAQVLLRHYLELPRAGAVFVRLLQGFSLLVPVGLALSALREYLLV